MYACKFSSERVAMSKREANCIRDRTNCIGDNNTSARFAIFCRAISVVYDMGRSVITIKITRRYQKQLIPDRLTSNLPGSSPPNGASGHGRPYPLTSPPSCHQPNVTRVEYWVAAHLDHAKLVKREARASRYAIQRWQRGAYSSADGSTAVRCLATKVYS